ncbi:hypothetical protein BJ875DRAFT_481509 [Amylocarpus encephaloides]|uniref:SprT-like domain-containing protein n=1 Tax=Amylocarpus encephaloides TaxID=45428 RepID=A0A9P7YP73_9HELO|nr:hypothetical protein BJ875DRAFT_481509 [Amylocarpus encephaloides]
MTEIMIPHTHISFDAFAADIDDSTQLPPAHAFLAADLSAAVLGTTTCDRPPVLRREKNALDSLDETLKALDSRKDKEGNFDDIDFLRTYAKIFDDLFFFGSMLSPGNERINLHYDDGLRLEGTQGITIHKYPSQYANIVIWRQLPKSNSSPERMQRTLITLLHEMVHAFLRLYLCNDCRETGSWDTVGKTGHGKTWLDIMAAATKDATRIGIFDSNSLEYARLHYHIVYELSDSGDSFPTSEALSGWGLGRPQVVILYALHWYASSRMGTLHLKATGMVPTI